MKLYLKNHTERYPVEQLQLQLFAQEPSEFCTEPFTGDGTVSSLSRGKRYLTATAKVTYQGKTGFAVNRVLLDRADVRATRRILQRSYYLAALQVLPAAPPWGALSGVRPTKLSTKCLMAGGSEKDAEKLLREFDVKLAIVTLGAEGCLLRTKNACFRAPAPKVHPVDTTGAGDIFGGSAMARFLDLEKDPDALTRDDLSYIGTYALMAASLSTERSGGIPSIPEKETVLSKL